MKKVRKHVPDADKPINHGHFSEDGLSYYVTSTETPRPWMNLLGNQYTAGLFSQCGQGFMYFISKGHEQVTNWEEFQYYPSYPSRGRLVFIKDNHTGKYWTGNPQPGERGFKDFYCRHEPGMSTIHAVRNGIEFTMRAFIPWDADVEIWTVTLKNAGRKTRNLSVFPAVEFPTKRIHWHFRANYVKDIKTIHFEDRNFGDPKGSFFSCDAKIAGYETGKRRFYGPLMERLKPDGVRKGLSNTPTENDWCVGVFETKMTLKCGQSKSFNVLTGRAAERSLVRKWAKRFLKKSEVTKALKNVREYWKEQRTHVQTDIPDDYLMQLGMNCWTQYCVDISMRFRSAAKFGYRDILQYCRGYMPFDPKTCRENILGALAYQYAEGRAIRGYLPFGLGLDTRDARDGVSWIADTLCTYVKETGDTGLLDEVVPYLDKGRGTVWDHACRAVDFLYKHRGRHRQCLVGGGDWNDALNLGGGKGRGESTWLTIATCRALRFTAEIARHIGRKAEAATFERRRKQLAKDVNKYAWDGDWYIYGFTDDGTPVGSKKNREGRIYANVQTWALMEGIVPGNREAKVWRAIYDYLMTDVGILVHYSEYTRYDPSIGRITGMPRGMYEHAASYVHGTGFLIAALARYRMGTCAVEAWHSVVPTNPKNPNSGCEPFGCTTYYTGPSSPEFGRSDNSWFTGSTSWLFFQCLESILGIKPDYDGLRIDPVIPAGWKTYTVTREFRGATYHITVRNPDGVESGVKQVKLNGTMLEDNLVPAQKRGTHTVEVLLG